MTELETAKILLKFNNGPEARDLFISADLELTGEHYRGLVRVKGELYYEYELADTIAILLVIRHNDKITTKKLLGIED